MDDLTTIKGIGKATAKKLAEAGVKTLIDLTRADAKALSEKPGFGTEAEIGAWIVAAKDQVGTIGDQTNTKGGGNADATVPASQGAADGSGEANATASQPDAAAAPAGESSQGTNTTQSEGTGGSNSAATPAGAAGETATALNFGLDVGDIDNGIAVITDQGTVLFRDEEHAREIVVKGPRKGRWRAGLLFGSELRTVPVTAAQLEMIDDDPALSWTPAAIAD